MAKLVLDITDDEEVMRIALYTSLQGYKLMYFINQKIGSYFIRLTEDKELQFYKSTTGAYFEVFKWDDRTIYQKWYCIKNKLRKEEKNPIISTENPISYWDKKHKKADFILEFEETAPDFEMETLMAQLREIPEMIYVQEI